MLDVTFHHFSIFYLLEIILSHWVQTTFKGRGLHQDINTRKWRSLVINEVTYYTQNKESVQ